MAFKCRMRMTTIWKQQQILTPNKRILSDTVPGKLNCSLRVLYLGQLCHWSFNLYQSWKSLYIQVLYSGAARPCECCVYVSNDKRASVLAKRAAVHCRMYSTHLCIQCGTLCSSSSITDLYRPGFSKNSMFDLNFHYFED